MTKKTKEIVIDESKKAVEPIRDLVSFLMMIREVLVLITCIMVDLRIARLLVTKSIFCGSIL